MNILILYATYSGGTQAAGETVRDAFRKHNIAVDFKEAAQIAPDEFSGYGLIMLCTPTWDFDGREGQPHEDYLRLMEKADGKSFPDKKFAVMGLGDSSYTHFCGSVDILEGFIKKLRGTIIVPSLRIDGYFYDQTKHTAAIEKWTEHIISSLTV